MRSELIPLAEPNLSGREAEFLQDCIATGQVSSIGPYVSRLEAMAATAAGAAHATATASGTSGLHVALTALGVEPGDLVILPSYTFIAGANAVSHCGALPWLIDIAADDLCLDPDLLAGELARETSKESEGLIHRQTGRRVAAIMPVHAIGMPADMDPLVAVARDHGLPVVADGAAALGARYRDRLVGEMGADLTILSFNGNKTFTCGGGGMVLGDDADLIERVRHLATTARVGPGYDHDTVGFNYRMTNLEAAVGCAQLERLGTFVAAKRRIQETYTRDLTEISGVLPMPSRDGADSACWLSGVLLDKRVHPEPGTLRDRLRQRGVDCRPFWKPMHLQAPYVGVPRSGMEVVEEMWDRVLVLPCSTHLSEAQQQTVVSAVKEVLA